jgi:cytochrome c nitrite reductase small subunit
MSKTIYLLLITLALFVGIGSYTFNYGEGLSYFSTDPKACMNCHIMRAQFDSWQKASHHTAATCVDCHLPHAFIDKYIAKAENGYNHSKAFTLQNFHEPIVITPKNSRILQDNCIECHISMVTEIAGQNHYSDQELQCVHCHSTVGHGDKVGLGGPFITTEYGGLDK